MDAVTDQPTLTLPVDAEHGGVRLTVVLVFVGGWVVSYMILAGLISSTGLNIIAVLGGFGAAYALTAVTERLLKQRWRSGRTLEMDANGVRTRFRGTVQQAIPVDDASVNLLRWHFQTRRRSRVPKGWHVLAAALEHDETYLSVYTFMSPDQFKQFDQASRFTALKSPKDMPRTGAGRDDLLLAGEQRRLYQGEQQRWIDGAELTTADFQQFLLQLDQQFPGRFK
jgi:hypothetical protein